MLQRTHEQKDGTLRINWTGRLSRAGSRRIGVPTEETLQDRRIGLNLRGLGFTTPFGLVFLYWYIRDLIDNHDATEVVVAEPANSDVANYLRRMHVPQAFADIDCVDVTELEERSIRERDLSSRLVELQTARIDHDNVVHRKMQQLMEVILEQSDAASGRKEELRITLSEVLSNIHMHSGTREAALAVQSYDNGLKLAFGDGGVGIPTEMEGHEALPEDPTDADIIRIAMERTVTSRPEMGGMGLAHLREIAVESGSLALRSGDGEVRVEEHQSHGHERLHPNCAAIQGTLVGIRLRPAEN